jgi:hypothetical protein
VNQDPAVRQEAHGHLMSLFQGLGNANREQDPSVLGNVGLGGMAGQLEEFMSMPMDMAMVFLNMAVQLTDLVLSSLEEAGIILVKGITPA